MLPFSSLFDIHLSLFIFFCVVVLCPFSFHKNSLCRIKFNVFFLLIFFHIHVSAISMLFDVELNKNTDEKPIEKICFWFLCYSLSNAISKYTKNEAQKEMHCRRQISTFFHHKNVECTIISSFFSSFEWSVEQILHVRI